MPKKKILIVDDEQSITRLLKFALEKTGLYDVVCENDGLKAFQVVKSVRPDLLLLDMNMPDAGGAEISAAIKEDLSLEKMPIVFLTGNVSDEEVESGLTVSGYPAMAKPINMEKLLSCIQKSLGG